MASHRLRQEMIQKHRDDVLVNRESRQHSEGPPSGLRAEGGAGTENRKRTSFVLFDNSCENTLALMTLHDYRLWLKT
eukprot:6332496-Amphidinium_carterae.1